MTELVTVPRVPTEGMLRAARDWSYRKYGKPIGNDDAEGCYAVMLAAWETDDANPGAAHEPDDVAL